MALTIVPEILIPQLYLQGCILKMCRNFTYEVVGQRRRLKATIKNRTSKNNNVNLFFDIIF
jgi:hypothetical protein